MSWVFIKFLNEKKYIYDNFNGFDQIDKNEFRALRKDNNRFYNDKVFYNDEKLCIIHDGVLLNLKELLAKYTTTTIVETIIKMYKKEESDFFKEFRGPFSGILFDKEKDKVISYCNQTGDSPLYKYNDKNCIILANNFNDIVSFLKMNNIDYSFNTIAATSMLTYGYLIDQNSYIKEIDRIRPGRYILCYDNKVSENIYYKMNNTTNLNITFDEAIELIDEGFKKAIKRCFDKDLEYGYINHLADMSGGLDSRMTTWVAKELGYKNITNMCYSKNNSTDEKAAKNV
ncbi:MAG: asparagine synthase, partial [Saccharofermentanales bacterium]